MSATGLHRNRVAGAAGVASALIGVGIGELAATALAPSSSPFSVVGGALIDVAPAWAKDTAIALFGTGDKAALLTGVAVVLLAVAAVLGICEWRWPRSGTAGLGALGVVVAVLATTRAGAGTLSWLPSLLTGLAAATALHLFARSARSRVPAPQGAQHTERGTPLEPGPSRRRFLIALAATAVVGAAALVVATAGRAGSAAVTAVRAALRLPAAAVPAAPVPAGAVLHVAGLSPLITPNSDFYRIDTALVVPQVDPAHWRLRVHGMVAHEVTLSWDELLALPLVESATTLSCVSNEVGGDLVGNAVWLGYPIRELLARAVPSGDADMVLSTSIDGFTAGTPLEALTDEREALLAIGMNGQPLPLEHGFPVRMVVPGLYGYVSATKWVTDLEVTRFDRAQGYWTDRGWSARGPIKLQSRIDVPRAGRTLGAGDTVIAGVAWQPHEGVSGVEVQVDDGPWQRAELATAISADTWVQWRLAWQAVPGQRILRCRAIGADGTVQTAQVAPPAPDGATGWHTVSVTVTG